VRARGPIAASRPLEARRRVAARAARRAQSGLRLLRVIVPTGNSAHPRR
jgi:hypothetical protein